MTPRLRQMVFVPMFVVVMTATAAAADFDVQPVENWSTAFAGEEIRIGFRVTGDEAPKGTLQWSHSANQRTLARGAVELRRDDDDATAEFELSPPELRERVIFETTVNVEFVPRGRNTAAATREHTLWLFPRNPIEGQSAWADQLEVELFDPTGDTADEFDELEFPYRRVRSAAPSDATGILVIGEGASLSRYRSLASDALEAAAAGRRVIMLAPTDGGLSVPGIGADDVAAAGEVRFARESIITRLEKRLDAQAWPGSHNSVPSRGLLIESRRGRIEAAISEEPSAWPWLEVRFPKTRGVLVICGFTVIEHWEHGPTPRFLLMRLLKTLERKSDKNSH